MHIARTNLSDSLVAWWRNRIEDTLRKAEAQYSHFTTPGPAGAVPPTNFQLLSEFQF